ncbi:MULTISPECIES: ABC transporter ATP-binding protein [unclassified Paenibacillus]|uniref:ABC transporter ATP-binding protein n=1 Tax=unclassified Paenibacillus TaxID=185978 RepID=UPI000954C69D|nr:MULTISPECIES: ABC transporter ATP-binding protein [unclassified Paenibacillus]ASS65437.1 ABC transporter ATP-binding protein [Paenibacillus sp. RUD330]SIQ36269.1 iron(III) transport system ATP-binding protein/spermidine/putrescine transport system ATP-binding protein [Paenibacillus sp. RU4X]SIQ58301.1 iron(III) transport system ATP-binding protein/spermidine/putrescine transport system ATP-binding protein [Paenibacillus sp. RU4T]
MNPYQVHIQIDSLSKSFGSFAAIRNVSLDIPAGSFTTLLGPSGCGKTTLMRLIAGFDEPDSGSIRIDGRQVNGIPAFKRQTPLVFQDYALFPHMTVDENIGYGLKLQKISRNESRRRVDEMLGMFGLDGLGSRLPKELSGGQQQRVAFARALVTGQKILMMDEPLSNLDAKMRVEVRQELRELQRRTGITAVFVTHDQDEALSMSDRIAVFEQGTIRQAGTPWEIYFKPNDAFVASFVGTANFIRGQVADLKGDELTVRCESSIIRVRSHGRQYAVGEEIAMVARPECISIDVQEDGGTEPYPSWTGEIQSSSFLGRMFRYEVRCGSTTFLVDDADPSLRGFLQGRVRLRLNPDRIHVLP